MTFPLPRFASLEWIDRMYAIDNWQRALECRNQARRYRRWGWTLDAHAAFNSAMESMKTVKHYARKAQANV